MYVTTYQVDTVAIEAFHRKLVIRGQVIRCAAKKPTKVSE